MRVTPRRNPPHLFFWPRKRVETYHLSTLQAKGCDMGWMLEDDRENMNDSTARFRVIMSLASAKPQVNTRILRLYADRYISRKLCLFGKQNVKTVHVCTVRWPNILFFFPKVTLSEIRWSICSCQKFRWVVRSEEAPSHEVRAPVTWMNFLCWEKAGCQRAKKKKAKETA